MQRTQQSGEMQKRDVAAKRNETKGSKEFEVETSKGDARGNGGKRGERKTDKEDGMSREETGGAEEKVACGERKEALAIVGNPKHRPLYLDTRRAAWDHLVVKGRGGIRET